MRFLIPVDDLAMEHLSATLVETQGNASVAGPPDSIETAHKWVHVSSPPMVEAALTENWYILDPDAERMIGSFHNNDAFFLFGHARDIFKNHLVGTFSILGMWNQPEDVKRTGLFHTAYSGDLFGFAKWYAKRAGDRLALRNITGERAEALTYMFGTVERGRLSSLHEAMADDQEPVQLQPGTQVIVPNRIDGQSVMSAEEVAKIILVTMADYLDQMVEVNGWRDHHQIEEPLKFYPGTGRPAVALHWISKMCRAVRKAVDVVPSAFNDCTSVISRVDETASRDAYWAAVQGEEALSTGEQERLLEHASELNPFVAEPLFLLAQIAYRTGRFQRAQEKAAAALQAWYALGSAWDKRLSFQTWVAHTRMLLLRANRRSAGLSGLPYSNQAPTTMGIPIAMLDDLVAGFRATDAGEEFP
jgi:hypothetical protein